MVVQFQVTLRLTDEGTVGRSVGQSVSQSVLAQSPSWDS